MSILAEMNNSLYVVEGQIIRPSSRNICMSTKLESENQIIFSHCLECSVRDNYFVFVLNGKQQWRYEMTLY